MKMQKKPSSDTFIMVLFIVIIVAALGIRFVLFLKGDVIVPENINMAFPKNGNNVNSIDSPGLLQDTIQEFSLLNIQKAYATGTVAIRDTGSKKNIFIQAILPGITSKYSYRAMLYGRELNEWKSLGFLEKNILGFYELKKEITQREMDYDEVRVTLVPKDRSSTTPGIIILKRELRAN